MRKITHLVVHCAATRPSQNIGVLTIRKWHMDKGWSDIGYHWVIRRDGTLETGRPEKRSGAHVRGHNSHSVGICLVGGINEDSLRPEMNYTKSQWSALKRLLTHKQIQYPDAEIMGHRDFPGVAKACPCMDVRKELKSRGFVMAEERR